MRRRRARRKARQKRAKTNNARVIERGATRFDEHVRIAKRIAKKLGKKVAKLTGKSQRSKRKK
jgi:hypothetical protein